MTATPVASSVDHRNDSAQTYNDLRCALARAGIHLPGLHVDDGRPGQRPLIVLGHVEMAGARKLVRILDSVRRP